MKTRFVSSSIGVAFVFLSLGSIHGQKGERAETGHVLAKFAVHSDGDALLLPVRVLEKDYVFFLDTGFTYSAFDASLALGEPIGDVQAESPTGFTQVKLFREPKARLGSWSFPGGQKVVGFDFGKMRQIIGFPIYGVIGMDFLGDKVLQIDFDAGNLQFLESAGKDLGQAVRLSSNKNKQPVTGVQVLGLELEFVVDTGNVALSSGWIDSGLFDLSVRLGKLDVVGSSLLTNVAGTNTHRLALANELRLDGFVIQRPCFSETNVRALSLGFLSRFVVTFDFPNRVAYLKKGKNFNRRDAWDRSGLHLLRDQEKTLVDSVDKGSSGERAGLKSGDEIVSISGRTAADLRLFEMRRQLTAPGETILTVIRRAGKDYQAQLKLAE